MPSSLGWLFARYNTSLNIGLVREQGLPLTQAYGNYSLKHNGSVYDYIRDHLGYRLELTFATATATAAAAVPAQEPTGGQGFDAHAAGRAGGAGGAGRGVAVQLLMTNNGFAAPINTRVWSISLLRDDHVVWRSAAIPGQRHAAGTVEGGSCEGGGGGGGGADSQGGGAVAVGALDWRLLYPCVTVSRAQPRGIAGSPCSVFLLLSRCYS